MTDSQVSKAPRSDHRARLVSSTISGILAVAAMQAAHAAQPATSAEAKDEEINEIVVTGSRIVRRDLEASSRS